MPGSKKTATIEKRTKARASEKRARAPTAPRIPRATAFKIGVSLPGELLKEIDRACRKKKMTRSELFRYAVEELFAREREWELSRQYVEAYRKNPETDEEIAETRAMTKYFAKRFAKEFPW